MAHFAQIDANNIVQRVLVITQDQVNTGLWGPAETFIKTSYNTSGGVYYTPDTNTPDPDQSKAFRKNYAGIGFLWIPDGPDGGGFAPPQPYPSWVLNSFSYLWEAPVPKPQNMICEWDEENVRWNCTEPVEIIPVYPE